jgi:adenylate kinase family enzyme
MVMRGSIVPIKVLAIGRPGTGKSTAARYITNYALGKKWGTTHINDYQILQEMFQKDTEHKKFRLTQNSGFDVIDFSVLDTALMELEKKVQARISLRKKEFIIVEFARDDYRKALKVFNKDFLRDSYILFLDADIDICVQRIHERITYPTSLDDHFVSEDILRTYYNMDNRLYMTYCFEKEYRTGKLVKIILNTDSPWKFARDIFSFTDDIFRLEAPTTLSLPRKKDRSGIAKPIYSQNTVSQKDSSQQPASLVVAIK